MKISDWGEQNFIAYLSKQFPAKEGSIGIGDDCAVLQTEENVSCLVTTDALVEGVHFLTTLISPKDLGYKVIAVNVSDIAAMGGLPSYAFFSIALPGAVHSDWLKELTSGVKKGCDQFGVQVLGGDTVGSKNGIFINVTLIGHANKCDIKYRSTASQNDVICVTGFLGDSAAGLRAIKAKLPKSSAIDTLIQTHVHPRIYLDEGRWLASQKGVHAMMDISDGLDCDLQRVIKASKCGAEVDLRTLPLSESLLAVSSEYRWNATELAVAGGEDYCLLLTISQKYFEEIRRHYIKRFQHSLHPIGQITGSKMKYIGSEGGVLQNVKSYDHFS